MPQKELGQRALSALKWSYGGAAARAVAQIVVQLALARMIGPEAFGQAAAVFVIIGFAWLLAEGGFGSALIQKSSVSDDDIGYALGWVAALSCSAGAVVTLSAPWLANLFGDSRLTPLLQVAGLIIPAQAISNVSGSLMRRRLEMRKVQTISLAGYLLSFVLIGLPLAWSGAGAWSVIGAFGVQTIFNLLANYFAARHTLRPRLRGDKDLRRFGLQVTGTNMVNWAVDSLDRIIIARIWGSTGLGEYSAASAVSRAPVGFMVGSIQSVTLATASRLQDDLPRLAKLYLAALSLVCLIAFPLFGQMSLHASATIHLLYGDRWSGAAPIFCALCAGLPFLAIQSITGPFLWSIDAVRQELIIQLAGAVLVMAGLLALARFPLGQAVWVVSALLVARSLAFMSALSRRTHIGLARLVKAIRGGLILALLGMVLTAASNSVLTPLPSLFCSSAVLALLGLAALRGKASALLAPELCELLKNRSTGSPLIQTLVRWMRLQGSTSS